VINAHPQVNHNYARDHEWNMWFVVTAADRATRDRILDEIAAETGCEVLNLPMLTDYYIDLEFPVVNGDRFARESLQATDVEATRISEASVADLSALDRQVLLAVQEGFLLSTTPYAVVAERVGAPVEDVLGSIEVLPRGRLHQAHRLRRQPRRDRVRQQLHGRLGRPGRRTRRPRRGRRSAPRT